MTRRFAILAFAAAAIWGGIFIGIHRALDDEDWPEW